MKTYLKRPYEKPLTSVYYSPLDAVYHFPSRVNFRQRIVQPSTKEQQRLISSSSSSSTRFQHVHWGKYGIKPIGPSDDSSCEQWQHGKKSRKRHSSSSRNDRDQCFHSKSDLQKKSILPSKSSISYFAQEHESLLILSSISLLLLLLFYIIYRRRYIKLNENKLHKLQEQQRRKSFENSFHNHEPFEYHLPPINVLPTIIEENSSTLSPSNSSKKFFPSSNSTSLPVVTDDSDSCNSSSTILRQQESSTNINNNDKDDKKNSIQISLPVKDDKKNSVQIPSPVKDDTKNSVQIPSPVKDDTKNSVQIPSPVKDDKKSSIQTPTPVKDDKKPSIQTPSPVKDDTKNSVQVPSPVKDDKKTPIQIPSPVKDDKKPPIQIPSPVKDDKKPSPVKDDKRNSIQISLPVKDDKRNSIQITLPVKDEQPAVSNPRRRSRFDQDVVKPTVEIPATETEPFVPPVIVRKPSIPHQNIIKDDYSSLEEINDAVKQVGLVHSQLIFGIDYTISNLETGKNSFRGLSLHHIQNGLLNPYQSVITIIGRTLEKFDSDTLIPAFGFGDRSTLDRKIFPLRPDGSYCKGFLGVLEAYNEITPKVRMSGPTNFAPLIREAIRIVKKTRQYHILVIVADGQVTNEKQTKDAIVEASNYPLSIVMIGVGDGPWDMMNEFDDSLPTRQFDNFQFVNYNSVVEASTNTDSSFALHALMEIPSQYAQIKELGLLKDN